MFPDNENSYIALTILVSINLVSGTATTYNVRQKELFCPMFEKPVSKFQGLICYLNSPTSDKMMKGKNTTFPKEKNWSPSMVKIIPKYRNQNIT